MRRAVLGALVSEFRFRRVSSGFRTWRGFRVPSAWASVWGPEPLGVRELGLFQCLRASAPSLWSLFD